MINLTLHLVTLCGCTRDVSYRSEEGYPPQQFRLPLIPKIPITRALAEPMVRPSFPVRIFECTGRRVEGKWEYLEMEDQW